MTLLLVLAIGPPAAQANPYTGPIKESLTSRIGWEVDTVTKGKVCLVSSGHCQPARPSNEPGGFKFAGGLAIDNDEESPGYGDVYVIDNNHRVQILSSSGQFVSMFGKEVDATTKGDVCTASSGDICQPGISGSAPGQFSNMVGVAIDPATGDVFVSDIIEGGGGRRVQAFTWDGKFVYEIGREVNETTQGYICAEEEIEKAGVKCAPPGPLVEGTTEPGWFVLPDALAAGGPEKLLYVGDEHRVQEFDAVNGKYRREISLVSISAEEGSHASTLTVDQAGNIYLVYVRVEEGRNTIRKFSPDGKEVNDGAFPAVLQPREPGIRLEVSKLAVDSGGRLAVGEAESIQQTILPFGSLLDSVTAAMITDFEVPTSFAPTGLAFDVNGNSYASGDQEVLAYTAVHVAELAASPSSCSPGGVNEEASVAFDCTLNGEANPEEVPDTEVWFSWGKTPALGQETPHHVICTNSCENKPVPVPPAVIKGILPTQTVYYRVDGYDLNVGEPEPPLSSNLDSLAAPAAPPRIIGEINTSFIRSTSVVMSGELNPENANTTYRFQYAPATTCEELEAGCPGLAETPSSETRAYGKVGATQEANALVPGETYRYRLVAENIGGSAVNAGGGPLPEGTFTAALAPAPQASAGEAAAVTSTSAIVSGVITPPADQPSVYAFELGVYAGEATQYGIVSSGLVQAGATDVQVSVELTGLQPGTSYTYRIKASSPGYGTAYSAPVVFSTYGLGPLVMAPSPPQILSEPQISFPRPVVKKAVKAKPKQRKAKRHRRTKRKRR